MCFVQFGSVCVVLFSLSSFKLFVQPVSRSLVRKTKVWSARSPQSFFHHIHSTTPAQVFIYGSCFGVPLFGGFKGKSTGKPLYVMIVLHNPTEHYMIIHVPFGLVPFQEPMNEPLWK